MIILFQVKPKIKLAVLFQHHFCFNYKTIFILFFGLEGKWVMLTKTKRGKKWFTL